MRSCEDSDHLDRMRPKPALWLSLPKEVHDAPTLAKHLRWSVIRRSSISPLESPNREFLETSSLLCDCAPRDAECLRGVVRALDAKRDAASRPSERQYWESLAHAVDRVADMVQHEAAEGREQGTPSGTPPEGT